MGSTFFSIHCHIVFATKERRPLLRAQWRDRLHSYIGGMLRNQNCIPEAIGGVEDHIHILTSIRPAHCLADLVRDLKKDATNWIIENFDPQFAWQEGYSAFSVSPTAIDQVRRYILNQEEHHKKLPFLDELKELLAKAEIKYEEKYLI